MNEKRFTLNRVGRERIIDGIIDNETDNLLDNQMDFCEKLNVLHEENEQLKQQVAFLEEFLKSGVQYEYYQKVYDENEQLKSEIEKITKYKEHLAFISDCSIQVMNEEEKFKEDYLRIATNDLKKLQEENEKLKEKNRRLEYRTVDMLDYIKEKGTITHQEMKEWWNTMMTGSDVE